MISPELLAFICRDQLRRRAYAGKQSAETTGFHVIGIHNQETDDYHLYVRDLPGTFTPEQIATLYGCGGKWSHCSRN